MGKKSGKGGKGGGAGGGGAQQQHKPKGKGSHKKNKRQEKKSGKPGKQDQKNKKNKDDTDDKMVFVNKPMGPCVECQQPFIFTAEEQQEYHRRKILANIGAPKRCKACKGVNKSARKFGSEHKDADASLSRNKVVGRATTETLAEELDEGDTKQGMSMKDRFLFLKQRCAHRCHPHIGTISISVLCSLSPPTHTYSSNTTHNPPHTRMLQVQR
jgi:hypothetical protein